jgi:diacylglycerol kinase family enzyme
MRRAGWDADAIGTDDAGDERLAKEAGDNALDIAIAVGGDGTVARVAHVVTGTATTLAIVPAGTADLVAQNLGIPRRAGSAIDVVLHGRSRRVDVGRALSTAGAGTFIIACGVGFDALVMRRTPATLKRHLGQAAYFLTAAALAGQIRNRPVVLTVDGIRHELEAADVLIANLGRMLPGVEPRRPIVPDDGLLDVLAVSANGPREGLRGAWEALRDAAGDPDDGRGPSARRIRQVWRARGTTIDVATPDPTWVELDGDPVGPTPVSISALPGALSVRVPRVR